MSDSIRVLVAEDQFLVSKMIENLLKELGYKVISVVSNGKECIEKVKKLSPDVILMDIDMPEMDGITAAEIIMHDNPTPIVLLTAFETPDLVKKATAAGVGAYIIKPPEASEVDRAITIARARINDILQIRKDKEKIIDMERKNTVLAMAVTANHEINQPLSAIQGYIYLLKRHSNSNNFKIDDFKMYIQKVERSIETIKKILKKFKDSTEFEKKEYYKEKQMIVFKDILEKSDKSDDAENENMRTEWNE